jgi:hypothetical protein
MLVYNIAVDMREGKSECARERTGLATVGGTVAKGRGIERDGSICQSEIMTSY